MKKIVSYISCLKTAFYKIHLVDRCLITFMVVLLAQSANSLLFNQNINAELNNIDVIVRTSIAGIFGYFLSANFIRRSTKPTVKLTKDISAEQELPQTLEGNESFDNSDSESTITGRLQIIVATVIGLFCLGALILVRNITPLNVDLEPSASITATVAQFRDLISGCVGFLIGCPTQQSK